VEVSKMNIDLKARLGTTVVAFRGYNVTNQGRNAELLRHALYGPVVEEHLRAASELSSQALGRHVDLIARVRSGADSRVEEFPLDVALIVAIELAQIRLLEQFHDVPYRSMRMAFGYSLGEVSAIICGGLCRMEDVLPGLLPLAAECAELAHDVTMGIVFSRRGELDEADIQRLCLAINRQGRGVVGISAQLSPNTMLILGQGDTIDRFAAEMPEALGEDVHLRRNKHHWPPLHTPILWERHIPNRAARIMHTLHIEEKLPQPPIFSLVTGKTEYHDHHGRNVFNRWLDHPQLLWDAVYETLASGADTVLHVGPEPNLIPATFRRLSENVMAQTSGNSPRSLGLRAVRTIWRPWLAHLLSGSAVLRAPLVQHVMLEDWLLKQAAEKSAA
jgi:[acyl-carrier-protein] S-malonyltransferase